MELVFEVDISDEVVSPNKRYLSIDPGLDNLLTIVSNTGMRPILLNGKIIKSINQWYNKERAYHYSILRKGQQTNQGLFTSRRLDALSVKRMNQIKNQMHKISKEVVNLAIQENVCMVYMGHNDGSKQNINIGRVNNQNFVTIPIMILIQMLTYKLEAVGIQLVLTEESYTSKASALDFDDIPTYDPKVNVNYTFSGKRISRGQYRSKNGTILHADCNGAVNILRKVIPGAFQYAKEIAAAVNRPRSLSVG